MDSYGDAQEVQFVAPLPSGGNGDTRYLGNDVCYGGKFVTLENCDDQDYTPAATLSPYFYLNSFEEGCYNSPSTWPPKAITFGPNDISPHNRNSWDYDNIVNSERKDCHPESSRTIEACTASRLKHSIDDDSGRQPPAEPAEPAYHEKDEDINYRFLKEDLPNLFHQLDSFFIFRHCDNADCLFSAAVIAIFRSGPRKGCDFFSMDRPYVYRLVCVLYGMLAYLHGIVLDGGYKEQFFEIVVGTLASQRQNRP